MPASSPSIFPRLLRITCLLALLACPAIHAADFYVAPEGKDTQAGTSAAPFREIRKALTVIAPGDTVHVADGSYKGFDAVGLGSATTTTTLVAPGGKAIITKTTDRGINNPNNIVVWQCARVVFDGFQSFQAGSAAMRIVECSQVTVRNCVFGDNQRWGIVTSHSDDLLIENNDCYGSIEQHGIYVANSGDRPVVRGNRFHGNGGSGLRSNGDVIQGGDGIITGAVFENNIIYDNGKLGGAAMNLDGLQDGIIRNNVLYDNHATGIALFKGGGSEGPKGMKVLNNTVIMAGDGRYNLRITDAIGPILVRNNFLYNANTIKGPFSWNTPQDAAWTDSDFNAFGGGRFVSTDGESTRISMETWRASGHEPNSAPSVNLADAVVNAAAHDYRPKAGSPLIDKASATPDVPQDVAGTSRPQGPAPDIGAWEYGAYASWRSSQGFPAHTPATSDSDADGISLLLEYALNMDPKVASIFGLPVVSLAAGQLRLQYSQFRPDLLYQIETSTDLDTWRAERIQTYQDGNEHTGSIPMGTPPQRGFLRLRVTLP
ncbi:MAG TPA: right-handed parallel beta-helix repeat-containing protein [Prosthecobacter sp.]